MGQLRRVGGRQAIRRGGVAGVAMPIVAATLLSGCYSYTPITLDTAPPGQNVRLIVSSLGAREVQTALDTDDPTPVITGSVERREGESLMLRVPLPSDPSTGTSMLEVGQVVRVPVGEILQIDRQHLSYTRTGLLAAGAAIGSALILFQILDIGPGSSGETPEDPDVLLGLFRIPIG